MAYSYNGWVASPNQAAIGIVHFEPIPGYDFPAGIKGGDVKVVFTYLVRQLDKRVEPIEHYPPGDEWGYAYRVNTNNTRVLSCHASGTAIDYNATRHPNRVAYTWTREQAREIHKIIDDELDGVIKWLEGFDEMHFEIRGTYAQVKAVADKIRRGEVGPLPPPPPPPPPKPTGEIVYRIYWFKTSGKNAAAYRCFAALAEDEDQYLAVEGWYITNPDELKVWKNRGLKEGNSAATAVTPRSSIVLHGGTYDNSVTY